MSRLQLPRYTEFRVRCAEGYRPRDCTAAIIQSSHDTNLFHFVLWEIRF